jgi:hypothetical protein
MNADRMASTPAKKAVNGTALGTVIINLQRTPLDDASSLRIWAKLDDVFRLLVKKLGIEDKIVTTPPKIPRGRLGEDIFIVPYDDNGKLNRDCHMILDLRDDAAVKIVEPTAVNFGKEGRVLEKNGAGHYRMVFKEKDNMNVPRLFGGWWVRSIVTGALPQIPVVNPSPRFLTKEQFSNPDPKALIALVAPAEKKIEVPQSFKIIQGHYIVSETEHEWSLALEPRAVHFVSQVEWVLDESFPRRNVTFSDSPFLLKRKSDHSLTVKAIITFKADANVEVKTLEANHVLNFTKEGSNIATTVVLVPR